MVPSSAIDRVWPPSLAADGPRAARDRRAPRAERVVAALCGTCGRSGGRAAGTRRRSPSPRSRAVASPRRRDRPRCGGRTRTTHSNGRAAGRPTAATTSSGSDRSGSGTSATQRGDVLVEAGGHAFVERSDRCHGAGGHRSRHRRAGLLVDPLRQSFEQPRPLLEHGLEIGITDGGLDLGVVAPAWRTGRSMPRSGARGAPISAATSVPAHRSRPGSTSRSGAVVHDLASGRPPPHPGRQHVVAVPVDRSRDGHVLADDRLRRHARGVRGADVFDRQSREHEPTRTTMVGLRYPTDWFRARPRIGAPRRAPSGGMRPPPRRWRWSRTRNGRGRAGPAGRGR